MDTPTPSWLEVLQARRRVAKVTQPKPTSAECDTLQIRHHWNLNRQFGRMGSSQLQQEQTDSMPSTT